MINPEWIQAIQDRVVVLEKENQSLRKTVDLLERAVQTSQPNQYPINMHSLWDKPVTWRDLLFGISLPVIINIVTNHWGAVSRLLGF